MITAILAASILATCYATSISAVLVVKALNDDVKGGPELFAVICLLCFVLCVFQGAGLVLVNQRPGLIGSKP